MISATQRRIGLGCALLLAIAVTVVGDDKSVRVEGPAPAAAARSEPASQAPARIEVAKLSRIPPAAEGIDVFAAKSWRGPAAVRAAVAPPPPQPVAPTLPFRYVGRIEGREGPTFLLSRGEESFSVKTGEPIDGDYRLESATDDALTIVYLPLDERQTLEPEPR